MLTHAQLFISALVLAFAFWTAPVLADDTSEAAVLHAEALGYSIDGNEDRALELLRKAATLDPDAREIAFERASLALGQITPDPQDMEPWLRFSTALTQAEQELRLSVMAELGRLPEALNEVAVLKSSMPAPSAESYMGELLALAEAMRTKDMREKAPSMWNGRVGIGIEADSNVGLLADTLRSNMRGVRTAIDINVRSGLEDLGLSMEFIAQIGRHLNNRANLGDYDSTLARLQVDWENTWKDSLFSQLRLGVYGDVLRSRLLSQSFMRDVGAVAELRFDGFGHPGMYVDASLRNFIDASIEGTPIDRDGATLAVGGVMDASGEIVGAALRAGVLAENTQGRFQRRAGAEASLLVSVALWDFLLVTGIGAEYSRYPLTPNRRIDLRVAPQVDLTYAVDSGFALRAGVSNTYSISTNKNYSYTQVIAQAGVQGVF